MTRDEAGRYQVAVSLAGVVMLWTAVVVLLGWETLGGPEAAAHWGIAGSAGAAACTVIYAIREQREALRTAFELGRDAATSGTNLHALRRD